MKIVILFLTCMGLIVSINAMEHGHPFSEHLPSEHFTNICEGSLICVKIDGRNYIECGDLVPAPVTPVSWDTRVFERNPIGPFGPDRAYVRVVNTDRQLSLPGGNTKSFVTRLHARIVNDQEGYTNSGSRVFITNGNHTYYADLEPEMPNIVNRPSTVHVLGEFEPNSYRGLHGTLRVWNRRLPDWVLRQRPAGWNQPCPPAPNLRNARNQAPSTSISGYEEF